MSEETRSYHPLLGIGIACVIVAAAVLAYFHFGRIPPPYSAQVLSFYVYPIHQDLDAAGVTRGVNGRNETFDEVLVLADVRLQNLGKEPLDLEDMWAVADLPGETLQSEASMQADFKKVFEVYPELKQREKPPLLRGIVLQPGQKIEGMMVFYYQVGKSRWDSRTGLNITFSFTNQNPLVLHLGRRA